MPEIPVPVAENHILNPNFSGNTKPRSPTKVSFGEVKRPGIFKVSGVNLFKGVESVSNFEVGEERRVNDMNVDDKGSVNKLFLFMNALTGDKMSSNSKIKYVVGSVNNFGREVAEMDSVIKDGSAKWGMTIIRHFVRYRMSYREIMVVCTFEPGMCMSKPEVNKVSLCVKIYNVPLKAWNVEGISRIASRIGNPIIIDRITTDMCERSYGRASFARVLVEVNSTKGLVDIVEVWYRSLGKSMMLDVKYVWRPPICEHCKIFRHTLKSCGAKDLTEEEKILKESMKSVKAAEVRIDSNNVRWQSVGYRRNVYGRGGFSNNGRGSFGGGRGGYMNNSGRGNGVSKQYVLVKTSERNVVNKDGVFKSDGKDQDSNDSTNKVSNDTVIRSGSMSSSNSKETKTVDVLPSKNRFNALNDEDDSEEIVKWREFYAKIDLMFDMGIVLTPKEVLKSRNDLLQKHIVGGNMGLKETATKSANRRIVDECNGKRVQSIYNRFYSEAYEAELEKIKQEMIEYYEGACEDMRSDRINGHFNDVVDGSNATTNFMANDEVSTLHDESMAEVQGVIETQLRKKFVNPVCNKLLEVARMISQIDQVMHFEVTFLHNQVTLFVSFVYAENSKKGRKRLWKNLVDHKSLTGDSPWTVKNLEIEDLNSYRMFYTWIEKRKDPNLGMLKSLDRLMGNGDFMNVFDRSYANFLPYMTSDHCPVILVFPKVYCSKPKLFRFLNFLADKDNFLPTVRDNWNVDIKGFSMFVLAKRLKNMKKHMRRLNKCNGNVFMKLKFLKTKLERVQRSLDKDPLNVLLKEEEMIYSKAYSDDVLDEEILMKQKMKFEWLREGDHNYAYFHKVLKGRVSKSRIEVVSDDSGNTFYGDEISTKFLEHFENFLRVDDHVFPIEDCNGLLTKKLDPLIASSLIHLVLDEEIKVVMFGIKDDKAVGELNTNLISIVPKLKVPSKLSDYRPIACCNVVYKCINDLLLLCHGDLILACILRRGLDEFSMPFKEGSLPIRYLGVPMMNRKLRNIDCRVLIDNVKKRILDWKNKYLSYAGLRSMKLMNEGLMIKHLWNVVSKKDSLWVKWVNSYRLKGKCIWSLSMSDNAAWCWRNILKLRDKIRDFVGSKIGNGKSYFIWFDKWHSNGPLCKLITHSLLLSKGFKVNDKIVDRIRNNKWTWLNDWSRNFKDVLDVLVPVLNDLEDKTIWFNKFEEVDFSMKEVCSVLRVDMPSVLWHNKSRTVDVVLNLIINTVRLKLLSLNVKWSRDVVLPSFLWGSFIHKSMMDLRVFTTLFSSQGHNRFWFCSYCREDNLCDCFQIFMTDESLYYVLVFYDRFCVDGGLTVILEPIVDYDSIYLYRWWTGFWSCTYDEDINNGMVFYDGFCGNVVSMIIVIYLLLTWPYFLCLDNGSIWDWYGDGVDFEVMIYLRKFILEHYDFSVLIAGLESCFVICSLWCFKLFGQIYEFLWWLEEYQEVVLHDDLNCYVDCIDWHEIFKKVQTSCSFFPPFRFFLLGFIRGGVFKEANSFGWHTLCTSLMVMDYLDMVLDAHVFWLLQLTIWPLCVVMFQCMLVGPDVLLMYQKHMDGFSKLLILLLCMF
ncbi:RNA-directed DNA polymerase, eukaryota, reverse transcriptase zinc-binding domain protein [Tanacetum coccineum]